MASKQSGASGSRLRQLDIEQHYDPYYGSTPQSVADQPLLGSPLKQSVGEYLLLSCGIPVGSANNPVPDPATIFGDLLEVASTMSSVCQVKRYESDGKTSLLVRFYPRRKDRDFVFMGDANEIICLTMLDRALRYVRTPGMKRHIPLWPAHVGFDVLIEDLDAFLAHHQLAKALNAAFHTKSKRQLVRATLRRAFRDAYSASRAWGAIGNKDFAKYLAILKEQGQHLRGAITADASHGRVVPYVLTTRPSRNTIPIDVTVVGKLGHASKQIWSIVNEEPGVMAPLGRGSPILQLSHQIPNMDGGSHIFFQLEGNPHCHDVVPLAIDSLIMRFEVKPGHMFVSPKLGQRELVGSTRFRDDLMHRIAPVLEEADYLIRHDAVRQCVATMNPSEAAGMGPIYDAALSSQAVFRVVCANPCAIAQPGNSASADLASQKQREYEQTLADIATTTYLTAVLGPVIEVLDRAAARLGRSATDVHGLAISARMTLAARELDCIIDDVSEALAQFDPVLSSNEIVNDYFAGLCFSASLTFHEETQTIYTRDPYASSTLAW